MADFGLWIMTSGLMNNPIFRKLVLTVTEHSFYSHFCAGKDLEKAGRTVKKLWDSGLSAMLDYGLEHATDNESCDRNLKEFLRTIDSTKSVDSCQVKPTPPLFDHVMYVYHDQELLSKMSEKLTSIRNTG